MNPLKNKESTNISKKLSLNRIQSVPSLKSKSYYITNKKKTNFILINKHILKDKDAFKNKNINRSTGNLFNERELKAIKENDHKYNIKQNKKISTLISLDKMNNFKLPEVVQKNINYRSKTSLNFYMKTLTDQKGDDIIMSNEEIFLLLKAKCKDIGINFRENMYFKFKEFCNAKCKNRVGDFSECNFSINSIRIISVILLDTNRLARLDLARNNIGNLGVEILVNSLKNSKTLVYLNLSSNSITHKGGKNIFSSFIKQQSIIDLNLSSIEGSNRNRITEIGIEDIPSYLNNNHFIETLNLSGNSIKNEGFILICQGLQKNQTLLNLDISNNSINEKGIKKGFDIIIASKITGALVNLNICNNHLANAGLEILSSNLKIFPNLVSLNLSFCGLEFKGLQSILRTAQHMKKMENLNVAGNNFQADNFFILKEYFAIFGLKYLNLSRCSIGDSGAYYLGECISTNDTLKYLNISGNSISDSGFKGIATFFKFNKSLEYFDCSCNFITNISARELFKNLVDNISLKSINFHDNQLNDEICGDIKNVIEINENLIHINLSLNRIQIKAIDDLNKKLKLNSEKRKINVIPEIEKNIRDLEIKPDQFKILSKNIVEKRNWLKLSYKKLKEDHINFNALKQKERENLQKERTNLENLKKEKKNIEIAIKEICKETENYISLSRKEENRIKNRIENEKRKLKYLKQDNQIDFNKYEEKKKEILSKVEKIEKEYQIVNNKYLYAKNLYDSKDKEYIEKFKKYQNLLDQSLLIDTKSDENKEKDKVEEPKPTKLKLKASSKKLLVKYNNIINSNNNAYKTTTISTGNTGKKNPEEKKSFNIKKK